MGEQIHIEGLGYRHPIREVEQIKWFMEKYSDRFVPQRLKTRYWLDFWELNRNHLFSVGAFELIAFIKTKVSDKQIENRIKYRLEHELKLQLQIKELREECENIKKREARRAELKQHINLN